jgi:hypothetical protein
MNSMARRFALGFGIVLICALSLNFLPYFLTRGAYKTDGYEVIGFPYIFHRLGGFAGIDEFRLGTLIVDICFAVVVALIAGRGYAKVARRD